MASYYTMHLSIIKKILCMCSIMVPAKLGYIIVAYSIFLLANSEVNVNLMSRCWQEKNKYFNVNPFPYLVYIFLAGKRIQHKSVIYRNVRK